MAVNVTADEMLDAVIAGLADVTAVSGTDTTADAPLRQVDRYIGAEFADVEGFRRLIAGRCPAVRVRFAGTRSLRVTMGRRTQRVESTIECYMVDDSHEAAARRQRLLSATEKVRHVIGSRSLGLAIEPLRFQSIKPLKDDLQMLAQILTFTTKHRVDYTITAGDDEIVTVGGEIEQGSVVVTIANEGTAGTSTWTYTVIALNADGDRVAAGSITTDTGAATLTGVNFNRLEWDALEEASTYQVLRTAHGTSPATDGLIATTALLTVDDTGLAASSSPEPYAQGVEVDFT